MRKSPFETVARVLALASLAAPGSALAGAPPAAPPVAGAAAPPAPSAGPPVDPAAVADFTAQALTMFSVVACSGNAALPAGFPKSAVSEHCHELRDGYRWYREVWLSRAEPFIAKLVPKDLPKTVVYPFGGGDLVSAVATFPDADEITTLSLEVAGDPRLIDVMKPGELRSELGQMRKRIIHLFRLAHSLTLSMGAAAHESLPGQLVYALSAIAVHGGTPTRLRYFKLDPDGAIRYLTRGEVDAEKIGSRALSAMELEWTDKAGRPRVYRHLAANLDDKHLAADPSPVKHLEKKGPVAAMTKAASYLLWWTDFATIRNYLLKNMVWMISDSTGIPPKYAAPAGFAQDTFGVFDGPFFKEDPTETAGLKRLWAKNPQRALPFRYGYPDSRRHAHMVVTRRTAK